MNSYAIYRIAETLRVLLFITLAILILNFYPVTAVMIVMLALLNDGAILSIAYYNVHYKHQPEAWDMRLVLGIATVLGIVGPVAAFCLLLPRRPGILPQPRAPPDAHVPAAVSGGKPYDLPDPHTRPVLVHPPRPHLGHRRAHQRNPWLRWARLLGAGCEPTQQARGRVEGCGCFGRTFRGS